MPYRITGQPGTPAGSTRVVLYDQALQTLLARSPTYAAIAAPAGGTTLTFYDGAGHALFTKTAPDLTFATLDDAVTGAGVLVESSDPGPVGGTVLWESGFVIATPTTVQCRAADTGATLQLAATLPAAAVNPSDLPTFTQRGPGPTYSYALARTATTGRVWFDVLANGQPSGILVPAGVPAALGSYAPGAGFLLVQTAPGAATWTLVAL